MSFLFWFSSSAASNSSRQRRRLGKRSRERLARCSQSFSPVFRPRFEVLEARLLLSVSPYEVYTDDGHNCFEFETTIDASPAGGSVDTPLRITYRFDSQLAPGTGGSASHSAHDSYGPNNIVLQLGGQSVIASGQGTGIGVFNDAGTTNVTDSYEVRADNWTGETISGQLFGLDVQSFRFLLVDGDRTMFSDTSLPLSPDFAIHADYQQTSVILFDPGANDGFGDTIDIAVSEFSNTPSEERTPFSLSDCQSMPDPDIDTTPPVTAKELDGEAGSGPWFLSPVEVTLSATDDLSGVDFIEYHFGDEDWQTYDGPFTLSEEGITTLSYRAVDMAGNVEAISTVDIQVNTMPWQNTVRPLDVNGDGFISPIDGLLIINYLNRNGGGPLPVPPEPPNVPPPYLDVNGDNYVSPTDVLLVINFLNTQDLAEQEFAWLPAGQRPKDSLGEAAEGFVTSHLDLHGLARITPRLQPVADPVEPFTSVGSPLQAGRPYALLDTRELEPVLADIIEEVSRGWKKDAWDDLDLGELGIEDAAATRGR